jgi:hypothetical protein
MDALSHQINYKLFNRVALPQCLIRLMVMYGNSKSNSINTASTVKEFNHFWKSLINLIKKRSFCSCWRTVLFASKNSSIMRWKDSNAYTAQHNSTNNAHRVWKSVPVSPKAFRSKEYLKKDCYKNNTKLFYSQQMNFGAAKHIKESKYSMFPIGWWSKKKKKILERFWWKEINLSTVHKQR